MSRARKAKKADRIFRWEEVDGTSVSIRCSERDARLERVGTRQWKTAPMDHYDEPACGVKYHVPHGSYVQHKGRKQLPRDYYSRR